MAVDADANSNLADALGVDEGRALADIREHGVVLEDMFTERQTVARVRVVEELAPGDAYDWGLVIMRKNQVSAVLPTLASSRRRASMP